VHDHSKLPEIFQRLDYFFHRESSVMRVIKGIMFHQSINCLPEYPNTRVLYEEEITQFLDKKDLEYLKILMYNDTMSYELPRISERTREKRRQQIDDKIDQFM